MTPEDDTALIDDAQEAAEFNGGFDGKPVDKIPAKEKPEPATTARDEAEPAAKEEAPKFVQVTEKDWAEVQAAARRTASYDQQFSKLFGTTGNIQKILNEQKATAQPPAARKIEIPKEAFAEMERDFPELAQQTRAALEQALAGLGKTGDAEVDVAKIEQMFAAHTSKREIEALEDAWPDWRDIVGAVDVTKEQPNPDNPFRKWLATKDDAYQARINGTESAAVIGRAIRLFQNETKAPPPKPPAAKPRDEARAERIQGAVKPKGDGAGVSSGKSEDDEFLAGFNSR